VIVGEYIRIEGSIEGEDDLVVHGRIEGTVRVEGAVTVEPGAWVVADVRAQKVLVRGTVRGNVTAREAIEVARSGRMIGDATAPEVTIAAGAGFRGRVEMGEVPAEEPPPVARRSAAREPVRPAATDGTRAIPRLARPRGTLRRRAEP